MAATSPKQCTGNQVDATTGMLFLEKNASMEPGKGRKGHIRNSWMYFTKLVPTVSTHIHHTPAYFLLYSNYYYCNKYSNLSILSNPCVCAQMLQKRWEQSCVHDHVPAGNQTWQHGNMAMKKTPFIDDFPFECLCIDFRLPCLISIWFPYGTQ